MRLFVVFVGAVVLASAFPYNADGGAKSTVLSGGTPLLNGQDPTLADDKPDCGVKPVDERTWKEQRKNWGDEQFRQELHFNSKDAQFENVTRPNGGGAQFAAKCETCRTDDTIPRAERACSHRLGGENITFYTTWMLPQHHFTLRELRVIESVLYHHPHANVVILSSTLNASETFDSSAWLHNLTSSSSSFADLGCRVSVDRIRLREWAQGTPVEEWTSNLQTWKQGSAYFEHVRELLKLLALYRFGGVAFDLDNIFVNRVDVLTNSIGIEPSTDGPLLSPSVMVFQEPANDFLADVLAKFRSFSSPSTPSYFTKNSLSVVYQSKYSSPNRSVTLLSRKAFCPFSQSEIPDMFVSTRKELMLNSNDEIRAGSFSVKLWSQITHGEQPMEGSVVNYLLEEFCVLC